MLKAFCLSTTLAALSFAPAITSTDKITAIQNDIARIEQAKTDSTLEMKASLDIANRSGKHFKDTFGDSYESAKTHVLSLLNDIFQSDEFITTLHDITDRYVDCIINENMNFNDIVIDSSGYPLEGKINSVLTKASPALNEQTEQMFNVFYVTIAIMKSSKLFCGKLRLKKKKLLSELAALEAAN
jgi:hypothetical protein